jgi:hypothetical protein
MICSDRVCCESRTPARASSESGVPPCVDRRCSVRRGRAASIARRCQRRQLGKEQWALVDDLMWSSYLETRSDGLRRVLRPARFRRHARGSRAVWAADLALSGIVPPGAARRRLRASARERAVQSTRGTSRLRCAAHGVQEPAGRESRAKEKRGHECRASRRWFETVTRL